MQHIYRPTFASFVDFDIAKAKKIALRTLVQMNMFLVFMPVKLLQ